METILQSDLTKQIKLNVLEAFTPQQLKDYAEQCNDEIVKSEGGKADMYKSVADEIRSFTPVKVYDDNTRTNSIMMVRKAQIAWDEPTDDISKSRSGVYLPTSENKKLGRVGKKYGSSDEAHSEQDKRKEQEHDEYQESKRKEKEGDGVDEKESGGHTTKPGEGKSGWSESRKYHGGKYGWGVDQSEVNYFKKKYEQYKSEGSDHNEAAIEASNATIMKKNLRLGASEVFNEIHPYVQK